MNAKHRTMMIYLLLGADLVVTILSFAAATYIRFGNFRDMQDKSTHVGACALLLMSCVLYTLIAEQNRDFLIKGLFAEFTSVLLYESAVTVASLILLYTFHSVDTISRLVIGYYYLIALVVTYITHRLIRRGLVSYWRSSENTSRILVVASKDTLEEAVRRLFRHLDVTSRIVAAACIDEDLTGTEIRGVPVISDRAALIEKATGMALDEVFICTPELSQRKMQDIIRAFNDMGVTVHYSLEMPGEYGGSSRTGMFGDYSVISYTNTTGRHRGLVIKRGFDILGSLVGLLLTALITPFAALAIKLDSPGPVFFSQTRVGLNGRRFRIYKFWSMYIDAEERKKELEAKNEMQGLMFKIKDDPRVTRVGRFLRRTSLDEFPQFLNILRGEMSLVGTRPPTEDEFARYDQHYRRRLSMTPGLTGMWQVSGRSDVENFDDVVRMDLIYIDQWSLSLDLKILIKTVLVVFGRRGAS
ncbi:MAG: sugar transferase [Lachnospiraceae bacterium]|nr:sugar transferase [Lachnospiraceae bacterium]